MVKLTKAVDFMRDNVFGDLVESGRALPSGALCYRMVSGNTYRLNSRQVAILQRYSFRPRYAGRSALSSEQNQ